MTKIKKFCFIRVLTLKDSKENADVEYMVVMVTNHTGLASTNITAV